MPKETRSHSARADGLKQKQLNLFTYPTYYFKKWYWMHHGLQHYWRARSSWLKTKTAEPTLTFKK